MRKAFTLMEVNLAIMIMAGGILSVLGLYSLGYRENRQSREDVAAAAYAELLLEDGEAAAALSVLREADFPPSLLHAEAVLETRALRDTGKTGEADARWRRHLASQKGAGRRWVGPAGGGAK